MDLIGAVEEAALLNAEIRMKHDFADKDSRHGIVRKRNIECGSALTSGSVGNELKAKMKANVVRAYDLA